MSRTGADDVMKVYAEMYEWKCMYGNLQQQLCKLQKKTYIFQDWWMGDNWVGEVKLVKGSSSSSINVQIVDY